MYDDIAIAINQAFRSLEEDDPFRIGDARRDALARIGEAFEKYVDRRLRAIKEEQSPEKRMLWEGHVEEDLRVGGPEIRIEEEVRPGDPEVQIEEDVRVEDVREENARAEDREGTER